MICASLYRAFFIKISSDYYAEKILLVNTTNFRGDYLGMGGSGAMFTNTYPADHKPDLCGARSAVLMVRCATTRDRG